MKLGDDKRFVYLGRTLVLGIDLLTTLKPGTASARRGLCQAVLIDATDTAAALYAAKLTTIISAVNTGLAVVSLVAAKKSG